MERHLKPCEGNTLEALMAELLSQAHDANLRRLNGRALSADASAYVDHE